LLSGRARSRTLPLIFSFLLLFLFSHLSLPLPFLPLSSSLLPRPLTLSVGQIDENEKRQNRLMAAAEEAAGIQKPFYRYNMSDPPPREGYTHRDGEKGIGYYRNDLKKKKTAEEIMYAINCADGVVHLTFAEAEVLKSMLLPAIALPGATVKQVIATAMGMDVEAAEEKAKQEEVKEEVQ